MFADKVDYWTNSFLQLLPGYFDPVGCIIHQLLFCRGVRPRNEYPKPSLILNYLMERLQNVEYPFIAITSRAILTRSSSIW